MKIHVQPIAELIRFFEDDQNFEQRDKYIGIATAVHSHEGQEVYLSGAYSDGMTPEHFELVYSYYTGKDVKKLRWSHKNKVIEVDLETGKMKSTVLR